MKSVSHQTDTGPPLARARVWWCVWPPQVNLKLFAPEPSRKRTTLLFVIRDKTKTPLTKLVEVRPLARAE